MLATCVFYPSSFARCNAEWGMGRRRAALSWPLLEVSVGGGEDKLSMSFGCAAGHRWVEREAGTGQQWAQAADGLLTGEA
jgi:hypothetical protein